MKIQQARDILNKLSPDELQKWRTNWQQMLIQITTLEVPVAIDIWEIDGLFDNRIKELIYGRMIDVCNNMINTLESELFMLQEKTNDTR